MALMKMNNSKILSLLDKCTYYTKKTKINTILYYLFLPIAQFLELRVKRNIWNKQILEDFGNNTDVIEFLNTNEFALIDNDYFQKNDIIDGEFYFQLKQKELYVTLKQEFQDVFIKIIAEEFSVDYENYININVNLYTKEKQPIYEVTVQWYRNLFIKQNKTKLIYWFVIFAIAMMCGIYILQNITQNNYHNFL